jgi:hypothetical protein
MPKTRHLTEAEKSIVLGHADYAYFYGDYAGHVPTRVMHALWIYWAACEGNNMVYSLDELALYLDSVTVEVE